jgi:hypothetical protein
MTQRTLVRFIYSNQKGKSHLTDQLLDTCWNSANGTSQHITINFAKSKLFGTKVDKLEFKLTFQGGFTAKETLLMQDVDGTWEEIDCFACLDVNDEQSFKVTDIKLPLSRFRLVFNKSTDFFGRITIYNLDILM